MEEPIKAIPARNDNHATVKVWDLIYEYGRYSNRRTYNEETKEYETKKTNMLVSQAEKLLDAEDTTKYGLWFVNRLIERFNTFGNLERFVVEGAKKSANYVITCSAKDVYRNSQVKVYYLENTDLHYYSYKTPQNIRMWRFINQDIFNEVKNFWFNNGDEIIDIKRKLEIEDNRIRVQNALKQIKVDSDRVAEMHKTIIPLRSSFEKDSKKYNTMFKAYQKVTKYLGEEFREMEVVLHYKNPETVIDDKLKNMNYWIRDVKNNIAIVEEHLLFNAEEEILKVLNEFFFVIVEYETKLEGEKDE